MAIAIDNAGIDGGNNGGSTSSLSFAFTMGSVSNGLLIVVFAGDTLGGNDDVTTVTYNGVGMTLAVKGTNAGANRFLYVYYLPNPASGSHNVVINVGHNHYILAGAASYSGIKQSGQPDNTVSGRTAGALTTLTETLTTVADLCWTMAVFGGFDSNNPPSAGAGTTRRAKDGAFGTWGLFDHNAAITPAGSASLTATYPDAIVIMGAMASFAPAVATDTWPVPPLAKPDLSHFALPWVTV